MEIAASFFNFGVQGTRDWIKKQHPSYSELEVTLEFVRLQYEAGDMVDWQWAHFEKVMRGKIRRDWARRFRQVMAARELDYESVARLAGFKSGAVVKATVTRGLPHFARLLVLLLEGELSVSEVAAKATPYG